jgi:hypothetical protein
VSRHFTPEQLSKEVIEDYLVATKICIDYKKPDGINILGYPATALLFCIVDALGHALHKGKGNTRLHVFNHQGI